MTNPGRAALPPPERLVINFHGLGPVPAGVDPAELRYWCAEDRFGAMLDTVGPLAEAAGLPIDITFDDGNLSDLHIALPALAARQLKATFFVCAGRIGQAGYLDRPALRELHAAGMTVGSHGWRHADWRRCDERALELETRGALQELAAAIGCAVDQVGVPFGSYDRRVLAQLRRSGVRTVFTSDGGRASRGAWLVPRLSYTTHWTDATLPEAAMGSEGLVARVRRRCVRALKQLR